MPETSGLRGIWCQKGRASGGSIFSKKLSDLEPMRPHSYFSWDMRSNKARCSRSSKRIDVSVDPPEPLPFWHQIPLGLTLQRLGEQDSASKIRGIDRDRARIRTKTVTPQGDPHAARPNPTLPIPPSLTPRRGGSPPQPDPLEVDASWPGSPEVLPPRGHVMKERTLDKTWCGAKTVTLQGDPVTSLGSPYHLQPRGEVRGSIPDLWDVLPRGSLELEGKTSRTSGIRSSPTPGFDPPTSRRFAPRSHHRGQNVPDLGDQNGASSRRLQGKMYQSSGIKWTRTLKSLERFALVIPQV